MRAETAEIIRWFANVGEREYPLVSGTLAMLDIERLRSDRNYGLKCFLTYMGARAGTPRGYVPAWLKAVEKHASSGKSFAELFQEFYHERPNLRRNPMWDEELANLDVPSCVEHVQRGDVSIAFSKLKIRGAKHKIKAMFLRDLAVFTNAERPEEWTATAHYLYCQPVDVWVGFVADCLKDDCDLQAEELGVLASQYDLDDDKDKMKHACRMINLAMKAGVSPLKLNQGVWFFASQVAPDKDRIRVLLSRKNCEGLEEELGLLRGFLPSDTLSGSLEGFLLQARMLPEANQQALARLLAAEISDERGWHRRFEASRARLSELADEALAEYRAGRTQVVDPDKL